MEYKNIIKEAFTKGYECGANNIGELDDCFVDYQKKLSKKATSYLIKTDDGREYRTEDITIAKKIAKEVSGNIFVLVKID